MKTVVCEYVIQDRPEDMPETRREIVRVDEFDEFVEMLENMTNVPARSFRVYLVFDFDV